MKKTILNKPISVALLLILAFSLIGTTTLLVQADRGGVGKYVDLQISNEGGRVTITKLSNMDTFGSPYTGNAHFKVGAGTIRVDVEVDSGYMLEALSIDSEEYEDTYSVDFKSHKGNTFVVVVFAPKIYTITAEADGFGHITVDGDPYVEPVPVQHGEDSPIFTFAPDPGDNHISSIKIDDAYISYTTSYAFPSVTSDHYIVVTFNAIGDELVVPESPEESPSVIFLSQVATVIWDNTDGGTATGRALDFPEDWATFLWNILTTATDADDYVTIALELPAGFVPDPETFRVYRIDSGEESLNALFCDVNNDGVVDGTDNSLVANAIKTYNDIPFPSDKDFNPLYDTNRDLDLTQEDLHRVHEYYGWTFDPLEWTIDPTENFLLIETEQFSIFRCR